MSKYSYSKCTQIWFQDIATKHKFKISRKMMMLLFLIILLTESYIHFKQQFILRNCYYINKKTYMKH